MDKIKQLEAHVKEWVKIGWEYTIDEVKELEDFYGAKAPDWVYLKAK